jgi:regulator of sirC expression with transglutaminase-like and TPR domain
MTMLIEAHLRAFRELARLPDERVDLADGALRIAALYAPRLDREAVIARLESLATAAASALAADEERARAVGLGRWLFVEQGFRGNVINYYDPRNSFLPDVLERRLGIPITLAVLYLELARRLGQPAFGVPLPGHFVIGVPVAGGSLYLDPFGGGELTREALAALAARAVGHPVGIERFLRPASRRAILARMLQNLKAIYLAREAWDLAARALDAILMLTPESALDRRDRGLVAFRLGQYGEAIAQLRHYLRLAESGPERDQVRRLLASITG